MGYIQHFYRFTYEIPLKLSRFDGNSLKNIIWASRILMKN